MDDLTDIEPSFHSSSTDQFISLLDPDLQMSLTGLSSTLSAFDGLTSIRAYEPLIIPDWEDSSTAPNFSAANRKGYRAYQGTKYARAADGFTLKLASYFAINDLPIEDRFELMANFTTHPDLQGSILKIVDLYVGPFKHQRAAVLGLRERFLDPVKTDSNMANLLIRTVAEISEADEPDTIQEGLFLALAQDLEQNKSNALILEALRTTNEERKAAIQRDYLLECLNNEERWPRQHRVLRFLSAYESQKSGSRTSDSEVVETVAAIPADWPPELAEGFSKFFQENEARFTESILGKLNDCVILSPEEASLEDLSALWTDFTVWAPSPIPGNTMSKLDIVRAKVKTRHQPHTMSGVEASSDDDLETNSEEIKLLDLVVLTKRTIEGADSYVRSQIPVEELINDYVGDYPGVPMLKEDMEVALEYLRQVPKNDILKGTMKERATLVSVSDDDEIPHPMALRRYKPSDAPGVTRHSKTARKTRIEFVRLDDRTIGILAISARDERTYAGRKNARR